MGRLTFSWDDRKDRANQSKHGVSFEEAATAFADENARLKHDPDHSQDEDRFILLGFSAKLRLLVVAHAWRQDETEVRIISARKAIRKERKQYGEFL
ncbi:MAG: BrnT family toxin [Phycisphaerae bacterium]|nr:BrnT family toxin [Phycisphaerae bacterium]